MPDSKIFCNSPWYELHIYWDGSYGFCCQESHKVYPAGTLHRYRVQEMSIKDWYNSDPMRHSRLAMFGTEYNSFCSKCYTEEKFGSDSRRHRSNQKSVIFTRTAFDQSYQQSPGHAKFEHARLHDGDWSGLPIDVHIDLGNYCNLACKMCSPQSSSKIAAQHVQWYMKEAAAYVGTDWTRDEATWQRVLTELASIRQLRNVHFMGGETLITKRFEDFVDFMIEQDRVDVGLSFVTNGTVFNERILTKLQKFSRLGIEVSIESIDTTNSYQRQGTDQQAVMRNIERYLARCDGSAVTLTLRPAISLLTIGSYIGLLSYALEKQLIVKALLVTNPLYLDARILPDTVKKIYLDRYRDLMDQTRLDHDNVSADYNTSNPNEYRRVIANQIQQCQALLTTPEPDNAEQLRAEMVTWCRRWDDVYGYDARTIYPELRHLLDRHGY